LRRCPACGRIYGPGAEFCGVDGTTLEPELDRAVDINKANHTHALAEIEKKWMAEEADGAFGFLYDPEHPERRFSLLYGEQTIGAGEKNDIVIEQPAVSWNHALIICRNERALLQDSASTNGTYVNDVRVQRPRELRHGDTVRFGNVDMKLWLKPQVRI
jgi:hypothetical protein